MTLSFMNNEGYIFIVRRLGKQSKLILSRLDSISNLKLNLRIHGQCGPDAHTGADLQAFLIFCFKPILISAHKLTLLIYGDNKFIHTICSRNWLSVVWHINEKSVLGSKLAPPSWWLHMHNTTEECTKPSKLISVLLNGPLEWLVYLYMLAPKIMFWIFGTRW